MTLLQEKVSELIASYEERRGAPISGRELSMLLGKSRNHLSQILNDGLIPSGEVLLKLGEVLEAETADRKELLLSAMRTKATGRARDTFWLRQALAINDELRGRLDRFEAFLQESGRFDEFEAWIEARPLVEETPTNGNGAYHDVAVDDVIVDSVRPNTV